MKRSLTNCPVCGGGLTVSRMRCAECGTTIEGEFQLPVGPFSKLSPEQIQFLLNFIRCEGRFTRLEKELNLSYPTLRNRLNEIIHVLGFESARDILVGDDPAAILPADERSHLLRDIE
ncbi:MAG: DUF2089 family protein [Anaerolineaceae bacterium]|nr:DUF2089 family protein [Anaerolineaceae bacterium]